jgi:hypothetical protein
MGNKERRLVTRQRIHQGEAPGAGRDYTESVQIVRLHDAARRPASWTEIIRRGQFAAFAKDEAKGVPCDLDGMRFADAEAATCAIFDTVADARAFCEAAVQRHPALRVDLFDADGRTQPPLLTVIHPQRAAGLETSSRQMRIRRVAAWALIVLGIPLMIYAYLEIRERDIILPAFFGINMVLIGLRLLWMNLALRETERVREERLRQVEP